MVYMTVVYMLCINVCEPAWDGSIERQTETSEKLDGTDIVATGVLWFGTTGKSTGNCIHV